MNSGIGIKELSMRFGKSSIVIAISKDFAERLSRELRKPYFFVLNRWFPSVKESIPGVWIVPHSTSMSTVHNVDQIKGCARPTHTINSFQPREPLHTQLYPRYRGDKPPARTWGRSGGEYEVRVQGKRLHRGAVELCRWSLLVTYVPSERSTISLNACEHQTHAYLPSATSTQPPSRVPSSQHYPTISWPYSPYLAGKSSPGYTVSVLRAAWKDRHH